MKPVTWASVLFLNAVGGLLLGTALTMSGPQPTLAAVGGLLIGVGWSEGWEVWGHRLAPKLRPSPFSRREARVMLREHQAEAAMKSALEDTLPPLPPRPDDPLEHEFDRLMKQSLLKGPIHERIRAGVCIFCGGGHVCDCQKYDSVEVRNLEGGEQVFRTGLRGNFTSWWPTSRLQEHWEKRGIRGLTVTREGVTPIYWYED